MAYYRSRRYIDWGARSRAVYSDLSYLFGDAVYSIRREFFNLNEDVLDVLFDDYGSVYGKSAETYARKTFPKWKTGQTQLSGQTMERLIELVPPYLTAKVRYDLLNDVLKRHKNKNTQYMHVKINIKEPNAGFAILDATLRSMEQKDLLASVPEDVMKAATWLYDDDITAARAMIAEAQRVENNMIKANAEREISLLKRTILNGQIKSASYTVEMPAGSISVTAYEPSKCFVATVCFGAEAKETKALRLWRDRYLLKHQMGRNFIVWYYGHGERISKFVSSNRLLLLSARFWLRMIVRILRKKGYS